MTYDLSLVVVTYNSADVVDGLLDSVPAALDGLRATVVVVDNGSADGTVARLVTRGDCTVVRAANRGYAAGVNRGVAASPSGVPVLVLNPDARLHPASIPPLLAALDRPGVGIVAPRILDVDGSTHRSLRREPTLARALGLGGTGQAALSEHVDDDAAYAHPGPADWAVGAALLVSPACLAATGAWDESYFLYSEETDFCLRAREAGHVTWYEPTAVVTHAGGGSGRTDVTHAMQILNRVRLYRRRHRWLPSAAYLGLCVLSELSWVARGHPQSRFAVRALVRPSVRPAQLGLRGTFVPS